MFVPRKILEEKLRKILEEDVGQGDITTSLVVPKESVAEAEVIAKESGIIAGILEAEVLIENLGLHVETLIDDGDRIKKGQKLIKISGNAQTILSAERTLLNIVSRMSGIATTTRNLVEKLQKTEFNVKVACTRKTAPGLLYFDKKAVLLGGGDTHRLHLDDMILIKDNHVKLAGGLEEAVNKAREGASFSKKIEVEVTNMEEAAIAAKAGADIVMLDNFSPKQIAKTVELLNNKGLRDKALLEASGGITADNVESFASTQVDIVSLGEITDSPTSLDVSLEIVKTRKK